jgi:hypothetical protein
MLDDAKEAELETHNMQRAAVIWARRRCTQAHLPQCQIWMSVGSNLQSRLEVVPLLQHSPPSSSKRHPNRCTLSCRYFAAGGAAQQLLPTADEGRQQQLSRLLLLPPLFATAGRCSGLLRRRGCGCICCCFAACHAPWTACRNEQKWVE